MTNARKRYNAAVEKRKRVEYDLYAHEKTYCRDTMNERRSFSFTDQKGARVCMSADNPKYDADAANAYSARCSELRNELARCKDEESRALFLLKIIEAPLNLIRFVRSCFKRIEEETRPK